MLSAAVAFAAGALAAASAPAFAEGCKERLEHVAQRVSEPADERDRKLVAYDVKRAGRELREGDETECTEALDHAETILDAKR